MKIDVSIGEIVDKVSILEIKLEKIRDPAKLANIKKEFDLLLESMLSLGITLESNVYRELKEINLRLWNIEDLIRKLDAESNFGEEFIRCARSVYNENDARAAVKRSINLLRGSEIIEEKEYTDYSREPKQ